MLAVLLAVSTISARPDIVFIMADDLGYRELGCYGQTKIPTPNLDNLARQGIRMTRAYSGSPVCAPTRYSLMTGKHQGRAAIRGNKEQGGFGPNDREGQAPIALSEITLPEVLKRAGYRNGIFGKWALGGTDPGQSPLDHGFDVFYGYLCQRRAHNFYPAYLWNGRDPDLLGNAVYSAHQRIEAPLASEMDYYERYGGPTYAPGKLLEHTAKFIRETPKGKPIFVYHAATLPHVALQAPKEWVDRFPQEWDSRPYLGQGGYLPNPRPRATYAAMIAYLDWSVGEMMRALEESGRAANTLIIFTSDNGATNAGGADREFFQSNGELRAGKMSLYEGGIRVPFIARWPGRIQPGTTSDHSIAAYDAMATFCEAASVRAPRNDGQSYLPALMGKPVRTREFLYFEYPEASAMQVVMMGAIKAIRPDLKRDPAKIEIYDLASDIREQHDLAPTRPDLVARALKIMRREHVPNPEFPLGLVDAPQGQGQGRPPNQVH